MKFRSERDVLVEALSAAARAVSTRAVGATTGLHLLVKGNELTATGTDLDLTVRAVIEVIGIDDGEAVVPARLVADAVRHLEPGAVTIEASDEKVEISAARSRFSLRTFPPADFPSLPINRRAVDVGPGRRARRGAAPGRPRLVERRRTAAAHRRALHQRGGHAAARRDRLVPARAVRPSRARPRSRGTATCSCRRARSTSSSGSAASLPSDAEVGVALSDTEVTFLAGETTISSRLIDGAYPDYRQLIPASYPNRLHLGKETVLAALRRARLLVRDNTTSVRITMHARRRRPEGGLPRPRRRRRDRRRRLHRRGAHDRVQPDVPHRRRRRRPGRRGRRRDLGLGAPGHGARRRSTTPSATS